MLVSTYQRPEHLRRCLESLSLQTGVEGAMEVIITDDGSTDETGNVVREFADRVPFRVAFSTHAHTEFQLARCHNEGVRVATAAYLLFTDGDCVLPPDHVRKHLEARRRGWVVAGDCYRLDQETSQRVTLDAIRQNQYQSYVPLSERCRLASKATRAHASQWLGCRMRPRLTGSNIGLWRADLERVNGFDESFVGWGLEDHDLQRRLSWLGLRTRSILHRTIGFHLWHERDPSFTRNNKSTPNLEYSRRPWLLIKCLNGLAKRGFEDLDIRFVGETSIFGGRGSDRPGPEIEILPWPSTGRFSGTAQCNVLAVRGQHPIDRRVRQQANIIATRSADLDLRHILPFPQRTERNVA